MNANSKTAAQQQAEADEAAAEQDRATEAEATEPAAGADAAEPAADPGPGPGQGADPTTEADPDAAAPAADDQVQRLEVELGEAKDKMMRALADAENTRRRAERDKQEASKYAIASFAREMLSVADNLRRALGAVDDEVRQSSESVRTLLEGVEMTEREMQKTFERQGIQRIEAEGRILDPNLHEAMYEVPDESKPQGTVVQVVEEGYTLHGRLLRPTKVGVSRGGPKPEPAAAGEASGAKPGSGAYEAGGGATGGNYDQEL